MRVAIAIFVSVAALTPLRAQDTTSGSRNPDSISTESPYRDSHRAKILATFLPGAGHIYAGEYLTGYGIWVATVTSFIMAPYVYEAGVCTFQLRACDPGPRGVRLLLGGLMAGAGIWSWVTSVHDAPRAAERANVEHRSKMSKLTPFVAPSFDPRAASRAGLSFRW